MVDKNFARYGRTDAGWKAYIDASVSRQHMIASGVALWVRQHERMHKLLLTLVLLQAGTIIALVVGWL